MRWTVHGERSLYESDWMSLRLVDVELPDGVRFEHHILRIPEEAAAVIALDRERGVLLLRRHRFVVDRWGWELPAGRIHADETPAEAAAREALEETGWRSGPLRPLFDYTRSAEPATSASTSSSPRAPSTSASRTGSRPSRWLGSRCPMCKS